MISSGLASKVTSAVGEIRKEPWIALKINSSCARDKRDGVPPPKYIVSTLDKIPFFPFAIISVWIADTRGSIVLRFVLK